MVEKVKSFLQKEFKKVTKSSLSLSDPSEVDVLVEYVSRIRCSIKVHKCYKIGGMELKYDRSSEHGESFDQERPSDPEFEKMVKLGGLK